MLFKIYPVKPVTVVIKTAEILGDIKNYLNDHLNESHREWAGGFY